MVDVIALPFIFMVLITAYLIVAWGWRQNKMYEVKREADIRLSRLVSDYEKKRTEQAAKNLRGAKQWWIFPLVVYRDMREEEKKAAEIIDSRYRNMLIAELKELQKKMEKNK